MHPLATLTCLTALAAAPAAQAPERPATAGSAPLSEPLGLFQCDGELVALGSTYKAFFRSGELEFVPAFGRAAATNHALRLRPIDAARGTTLVRFAPARPEPQGRDTVCCRLSPTVCEVDTVLPTGVEQTLVFAARPAGDGDLVVTCALACDVPAEPTADGGVQFVVPGAGAFTIGGVTGVDADGHRVRGTLRADHSTLTMTLPAAFVDAAAYPLVLDPLLGGPTLVSGLDRQSPDVVYDPGTGDWCAVWVRYVSASDADVYAQRIAQTTGSPVGAAVPVDVSTADTEYPQVGSVRLTGRVLVVYQVPGAVLPPGPDHLVGRTLNMLTGAVSAGVTIGSIGGAFAVASEATTADDEALVVWGNAANDEVLAAQVTVPATGTPSPSLPVVVGTGGFGTELCSISKTASTTGNYLIAWRTSFPLLNQSSTLYGVLVSRNLAILSPVRVLDANALGTPSIDCSGSSYLVAYSHFEPGSSTLADIVAVRVVYLAVAGVLTVASGPAAIEATPGQDESVASVAWLGQRYAVTFTEDYGSSNENVGAWLVNPDCTTCSTRMTLSGINLTSNYVLERFAAVAGRAAWLPGVDDGEVVYVEDQVSPSHPIVVGQRVADIGAGGAVTSLGGGCGQGGLATATANGFALGNLDCRFEVAALPAGALPLCCLGVPSTTIACGGCTFVNALATYFEPNVGGIAQHSFAVPCDPIYLGFQMEVQWVSLLTPSSPCPLLPGVSASNRVRFTVGP